LPRESMISRAVMAVMLVFIREGKMEPYRPRRGFGRMHGACLGVRRARHGDGWRPRAEVRWWIPAPRCVSKCARQREKN